MSPKHCWLLWTVLVLGCGAGGQDRPWPTDLPPNPEDGNHFDGESDPYYEGWYHKVALPGEEEAFFFIYTVVNPMPETAYPAEAFLYCGRASSLHTVYGKYPVEAYSAARGHRDVRIGEDGRATALRFAGQVDDGEHACSWDVDLEGGIAWPETMGWLTGAEGMETNWTVGTLTASATGFVEFDGERFVFEGQPGYGDHNWGIVFPRQWIWMQANDFPEAGVALAASGGTVQFGETEIEAHMIGMLLDGEVVTFRSQDLDAVQSSAERGSWSIAGEKPLARIAIEADCDPDSMFHLLAPMLDGMQPRAWESLFGRVEVTLERRASETDDWQLAYAGTSRYAGVEIGD